MSTCDFTATIYHYPMGRKFIKRAAGQQEIAAVLYLSSLIKLKHGRTEPGRYVFEIANDQYLEIRFKAADK